MDNFDLKKYLAEGRLLKEVMDEEKHKTLGDYELPETEKEWDSLENRITRSTWFRQTDKQKKKMIDFFKRKILRRPRDR